MIAVLWAHCSCVQLKPVSQEVHFKKYTFIYSNRKVRGGYQLILSFESQPSDKLIKFLSGSCSQKAF